MAKPKSASDIGRIKYWSKIAKGDILFGDVDSYGDEVKAYWKKGQILICDPVTGQDTLADLEAIEYEKQPFGWTEYDTVTNMSIDTEYDRYINDAYKAAMALSDSLPDGVVKGKLFSVGVGDGSASYVVTKVNKKSVKIEWRGFCPDQWVDQTLGYGGSFPKHCIERHCDWADTRKKMFA
jgi:hypothetical protein